MCETISQPPETWFHSPGLRRLTVGAQLLVGLLTNHPVGAGDQGPDPSEPFFDGNTLQTVHLEIASEDWDRMRRALPQRIMVPGTFRWGNEVLPRVGIRFRGNSSSPPDWPFKRSFLISFNEFEKGQRFLGLRHVALDNGIQFGGLFSERLITDILCAEGVKASRCSYARVYLNGLPAGVFVNVERIDRSFLERHFASDAGPLFKVDEGGPGSDLRYLGEDLASYRQTFDLRTGNRSSGYSSLVEFTRLVSSPTTTAKELEQILSLDAFLKTTAILLLSGAFDQLTGWNPHNYYLYRDPSEQRWTYLPWDLDVGFADHAFGRIPVLAGWHAAWPAPVPGRPLMETLISDPVLLTRYRQHARRILETWFKPDVLIPKLRDLYEQIRPALAEDPHPLRRVTVPTDAGLEDVMASMERFIRDRYALARAQLETPGERPTPLPVGPTPPSDGPSPGPPSPDAPRDLQVVKVTSDSVQLQWVDHAAGEVAHIVQRCSGRDCSDFANAIGLPGGDITRATDRNVQPGMTYRYRVYAVHPTPQGPRGTGVSNPVTVSVPGR